jgi:arylsulfatase A-like enzyme
VSEAPNILLIMADQLVSFLTGAYGHPVVQTPNLDRLVEAGVRFDAAGRGRRASGGGGERHQASGY